MFGSNKAIDLDLGAFVELADGYKSVVQALGNAFGNYHSEPYVQLQGDDRTGEALDGNGYTSMAANGKKFARY